MAYQYGDFGKDSGSPVMLTEQTLHPFLVVWLMFVVNPDIIGNANPSVVHGVAAALNLSPECVEDIFMRVRSDDTIVLNVKNAALSFQVLAGNAGYNSPGGQSCGVVGTILGLATKGAVSDWNPGA